MTCLTLVGCSQDQADRERCGESASCNTLTPATAPDTVISCEPVPRFRLGGVEYENRRFDATVTEEDVGSVVGAIRRVPSGVTSCETVSLEDGDGTWPVGTQIHQIDGVGSATALTASLGNGVYLRFDAKP